MTNKVPPNSPPIPLLWRGQGVVGRGMSLLFVIGRPQRWHQTGENDKRKKCHSERSEESLRLAYLLLRCDSSLRSERSYENQSMCLFRLRNK